MIVEIPGKGKAGFFNLQRFFHRHTSGTGVPQCPHTPPVRRMAVSPKMCWVITTLLLTNSKWWQFANAEASLKFQLVTDMICIVIAFAINTFHLEILKSP
jgi:hypothetical protein